MPGRSLEAEGMAEVAPPAPAPTAPADLSFKALYQQHFDFVWSSARRLGIEPSGMDDLIQEVFLVIHSKVHTLEKPHSLRSWIYGIVRRVASNHRREKRVHANAVSDLPGYADAPSQEPTPLEQTERNARLQILLGLLNELEEYKREIFALVELDELSVPEAAEVLEIPLNTAYSRLRVARQAFEAAVARHEARTKGT